MRYLLLFPAFFLLVNCIGFDYDYRVSNLPSEKLTFEKLPINIQECLSDSNCDSLWDKYGMILISDKDYGRYQMEMVPFGPWIKYMKLIDIKKNIVYRIERDRPDPCIIYSKKLYIADEYNFLSSVRGTTFYVYELK